MANCKYRFGEKNRQTLLALAEVALPAGRRFPADSEGAVSRLEDFLCDIPRFAGKGYEAMATAFEQAARLKTLRPFSKLSAARQLAFLESLAEGSFPERMMLRVILAPLKTARYAEPEVFKAVEAVLELEQPADEERPRYMERAVDASDFGEDEELEADVVVVGTGAGGAAIAAELAEQGLAVVMLEEGDYFTRKHFNGRALEMQKLLYRDGGATIAVGNCWIPIFLGRCVGGTTTVNSGTCYRIPDRVLHKWRDEFGLRDFTPEAMAPHFAKVEKILQVERADLKYVGGMGRVISEGCDALGITRHNPLLRNAPDCDGQGVCCWGCPTDAKRSTNVSYVPLALRYGANLFYNAEAEEILLSGDKAVGVRARTKQGHKLTVKAGAVVLSCGTMMTPLMLMKNRLGNRSGQLGRNLSIHPAVGIMGVFPYEIRGYSAIPQGYAIEEFHDEGLLYEGAFVPMDLTAGAMPFVGSRHTEAMEAFERMACFGFMVEDTSRGRVRLGPAGRPVITYNLNRHDVARMKRGMEILFRVYFAAGAERVFAPVAGFQEMWDLADVERFRGSTLKARNIEMSAYHPLGTVRMGRDASSSVVSSTHELHDIKGLFVADGSAVPSSIGVNPQVTIMAMATRAAQFVAQRVG